MRRQTLAQLTTLAVGLAVAVAGPALEVDPQIPLAWSEDQRAFLQDGPGLLLTAAQVEELLSVDGAGRAEFIDGFLGRDPLPATPENELREGVERRRKLVRAEFATMIDERAQLLFLNGFPSSRKVIDCAETFKPLELWSYPAADGSERTLVLYQPKPDAVFRLWLPIDSKRALYNPEMEYWLSQWEELRGRIFGGKRFDREICDESKEVDAATGVDGLYGFEPDRPKNEDIGPFLGPPADLAAWAERAAATEVPPIEQLTGGRLELSFPEKRGLRMVTRMLVVLPPDAGLETFVDGDTEELRLVIDGHLEYGDKIFETFRVRYQLPKPLGDLPVGLAIDRPLRPGQEFLARLRIEDETSGRQLWIDRGFEVARTPTPTEEVEVAEEVMIALGEELEKNRIEGRDSLILVPPETDVVFGLWRAEALVTGSSIEEVAFFLDDQKIMTRRRPPFTAELRLSTQPKEQVVRADGFDSSGELVASDQVVINQPRGELQVRILEPVRGRPVAGEVQASAEVVVPEEKFVRSVTFSVNEELLATLERPPWEAKIAIPSGGGLTYLTVTAELDDGSRAEDVRFLNVGGLGSDNFIEEVDVNLVELYTTVTDRSGRLVKGLTKEDFEVWEDGRPQEIVKFELVQDLPLTLGIVIDTSGSMYESLAQAQRTAVGFLDNIITQRDRAFALAFSDRPALLMERTSDVGAIAERLEGLSASGATSLHDAVITSLYYYRGIRGRRAMVLLSDGEDTSSTVGFNETLEYARRSGVAIYSIGLRIGRTDFSVRRKLEALAEDTGGRTFYISEAEELANVYDEIEEELRSQYLAAYNSDASGGEGEYHEVEVEVKGGKLKARTIRGYYS